MKNIQLLELKNHAPIRTEPPLKVRPEEKFIAKSAANNLSTLTDKDLLALCQKYGTQAIFWKWKFIGLLPEVDRRGLYEKKKCSSVYEFAAKFGGVTNEQVRRVISIDKKLAELGLFELRSKLINGDVSLNKLARIVSVANGGNEPELVKAVTGLSKSAVETLVRDEKNRQMSELLEGDLSGDSGQRCLSDSANSCKDTFVPGHKQDYEMNGAAGQAGGGQGTASEESVRSAPLLHTASFAPCVLRDLQELGLDPRVVKRLKELKAQGRDINKVMNEMLDKREVETEKEVEEVSEEVVKKEGVKKENGEEIGRYVPADVKKAIEKRGGDRCEVKGCAKPAKHLHHTIRFGIQKSHDPRFMVQLCAEHHQITHVMDGVYLEKRRM